MVVVIVNVWCEVDVLLVCCGGGLIEDLWLFNDEVLVCVIVVSELLVVSGVGYEIDFMIVDFVVDLCVLMLIGVVEFVSL